MNFSNFSVINYSIMLALVAILIFLYFGAKDSNILKKAFIIATVIFNVIYLCWRTIFTLPLAFGLVSSIIGILLLLSEFLGFWQSLFFRFLFWKPFKNHEFPPNEFEKQPTVDVFIATYNENTKILRKTITGCLNLDYPKELINIYLCDDGRRAEAKQLCDELSINYITRQDNKFAKAGNINNALKNSSGEFIVLLDADMVPKSNFLKKTIGYFVDTAVGFVQTPQVFYNPDPYQFNLGFNKKIPNEQDFFMVDIQGGRANFNAVLHVGTNAVFRREAIDAIGGIPTGTITEDMATGMLIQAKGYQSIFVKETLCTGLCVETFSDLVKQRDRWCRGNIQVTKKWNPLFQKGLDSKQKLIYIDGFLYWFFGIQKIIYILCPLIYLIFGVVIFKATAMELLLFWTPSFFASTLVFKALTHKNRSLTWSHIYEVAMAPFLALASLSELFLGKSVPFIVTPKGVKAEKTSFSWHIALPNIILLALTIIGWVVSIPILLRGDINTVNSLIINFAWSFYNVFALVLSILICIEKPRKRASERLVADEKVIINSIDSGALSCSIEDISEDGVQVKCEVFELTPIDETSMELNIENIGIIKGEVAWSKTEKDEKTYGVKFKDTTEKEYSEVAKYISDNSEGYHDNK